MVASAAEPARSSRCSSSSSSSAPLHVLWRGLADLLEQDVGLDEALGGGPAHGAAGGPGELHERVQVERVGVGVADRLEQLGQLCLGDLGCGTKRGEEMQ